MTTNNVANINQLQAMLNCEMKKNKIRKSLRYEKYFLKLLPLRL